MSEFGRVFEEIGDILKNADVAELCTIQLDIYQARALAVVAAAGEEHQQHGESALSIISDKLMVVLNQTKGEDEQLTISLTRRELSQLSVSWVKNRENLQFLGAFRDDIDGFLS